MPDEVYGDAFEKLGGCIFRRPVSIPVPFVIRFNRRTSHPMFRISAARFVSTAVLNTNRRLCRVDPNREIIERHFKYVSSDAPRIACVVGQPLGVGNQYVLPVRALKGDPALEGADAMAKMERAGRAISRQHNWFLLQLFLRSFLVCLHGVSVRSESGRAAGLSGEMEPTLA